MEDNERQKIYNEEYYLKHFGLPYDRTENHWSRFFGNIADQIVQLVKPQSVLDMGCAKGFLVEALRDRGVDAHGIDVSAYAIGEVRDDIKPFCKVASVTDPIDRDYDLITCIEVLEHVTMEEAKVAVRNIANRTQNILFSSAPHVLDDPTHINVHPVIYWLELYSEHGFYPDITIDASFATSWAMLLRKNVSVQDKDLLHLFARLIDTNMKLNEKDQEIAKLQARVEAEQKELNRFQTSLGWGLIKKCEKVRDRIFPKHTRRRDISDLILKRLKKMLVEGKVSQGNNTIKQNINPKDTHQSWMV